MRWMWVLCGWLGCALAAWSAPAPFTEDLDTPLYDCTVTVTPARKLSPTAAVRITLERAEAAATLLTITQGAITLATLRHGKTTPGAQVAVALAAGTPAVITVLRRGTWCGLLVNGAFRHRGELARAPGAQGLLAADAGWAVDGPRIQRLEPVAFADNFMRTADEAGGWATQSGAWALQSAYDTEPEGQEQRFNRALFAQNPFAWVGRNPQGAALCTAGKPFWEDYTFTAAVHPQGGGAVGLACNMTDGRSGLLLRWSAANDRGAQGDRLVICALEGGKPGKVLAQHPGGYVPGQWYKISVTSTLGQVRVSIDERERLTLPDAAPWRGGVGLYTEGAAGALFDDITVYGRTLKTDLLAEGAVTQINERFKNDAEMQGWAGERGDWTPLPGQPGQWVNRWEYFGDHWLALRVKPRADAGELTLLLCSDGKTLYTGYRASIRRETPTGPARYTLYRGETVLATHTGAALQTGEEYGIRFRLTGDHLRLDLDGVPVIEAATGGAVAGARAVYSAQGGFAGANGVLVMGRRMLDYSFADAPVDWRTDGTWAPTIRWTCAPQWSFLAGWSRGEAVLWHKQRFTGDQSLQAYAGIKMEYPRQRDIYEDRYRFLAVTICGDGADPRTGYTAILGAPDEQGRQNMRTVLLRNGKVVRACNKILPSKQAAHHAWFDLTLTKRGDTVELWIGDLEPRALQISFTDPDPIDGGVPAIWTLDNGICLARARLFFRHPPQPRTDALVAIDEPWFPEWANRGTPLALDFSQAWSTSGTPVRLQVLPREAPEGAQPPAVDGLRTTFTPAVLGEHWYQIRATDGTAYSPSVHFSLPVFDPALKRDDSRAVVLYRFDEGDGTTVHDHSPREPAVDLTISKKARVAWLPGQGLSLRGPMPLMSKGSAGKLMSIADTRACTIECWVSPDTVDPPTEASGCLLSWELSADHRNFAVGQSWYNLIFAPGTGEISGGNWRAFSTNWIFKPGLLHLAITWDGTTSRMYQNGVLKGSRRVEWQTAQWSADAPLLLGNQPDLRRNYLGTYYLVAIHDRCLTDGDVLRHYKAGPSAR